MANKPLKSIKFPGLDDTYTVPEVDDTLATTGAAADAKTVGDEISDIKADLSGISEYVEIDASEFEVASYYINGTVLSAITPARLLVIPASNVYKIKFTCSVTSTKRIGFVDSIANNAIVYDGAEYTGTIDVTVQNTDNHAFFVVQLFINSDAQQDVSVYKNGITVNVFSAIDMVSRGMADDVPTLRENLSYIQNTIIPFSLTNVAEFKDKSSLFTSGKYIPTAAVGSTIDVTTLSTDSDMAYLVFAVDAGDAVYIKGRSKTGSNRRYYNITDSNYNVLQSGVAGSADREDTITVTQAGYAVVNLNKSYAYAVYHQDNKINRLALSTQETAERINISFNSYIDTPYMFRFYGKFKQGEFGGFSDVDYGMRLVNAVKFDSDIMLFVPDGFGLVVYYTASSSRVSYNNFVYISKNTYFVPAIIYAGEAQSQTMTEDVARANLLYTIPISFDRYKETFSSPAIFDNIGIIGDSYALGSMHWGEHGYKGYSQYSWGKLMCKRNGNNCTLYAHGGYGISRWITNILPTVLADDPKDLYWWGLGINDNDDARVPASLGSIDDLSGGDYTQYPDTLYGMYGKAFEQVAAHAPLAKHVFVTCIKETPNHRWTSYKAINTLLEEIAEHYEVPFIDLVDDPFYFSKYYIDQVKTGHPTLIGYGGMSYANERLLNRCVANNVGYFIDYGRTDNPDDVDPSDEL